MFVNSLFLDFLLENGLNTWKDESTRDIICLEFNYGTRSYSQELKHLYKIARQAHWDHVRSQVKKDRYLIQRDSNKVDKIQELLLTSRRNRKKYHKLSKFELRTELYNNGIDVEYVTRDRFGEVKKRETIHYKMLYRSTGKAKKGTCMFICDRLYDIAHDYLYMGIKLPDKNAPIVEASAYAPLVSSGIVGRVRINPKNILVLEDVDRYFKTDIINVEVDTNKQCVANHVSGYELKNTLFDGQALIDSSIFPDWGSGYILLRQHFCKMAAFSTNIQLFFKDYFGEDYETATITDMFGNEHYVKDIELITTDNAMKWLKMDVSYDYWCEKVTENDCNFGIVKTAHPSKLGEFQKMSYQMVNSLDMDIMPDVVRDSLDYVKRLKTDDDFFLEYLRKNDNFSNDYNVLIALCEHNHEFIRSSYFRNRRKHIIEAQLLKMKTGELIQNADNLVIVGSPYAMLLYGATGKKEIVDEDDTFCVEDDGSIQCYTTRFDDGEYLAEFRSPFNSKNNLGYLHNKYDSKYVKYFNFSDQIVAINMNGTCFQDKNNGSDQDSDSIYVTNQPQIVEHARRCQLTYPTIVNNIPKEKNHYDNTMNDFARVDDNLAKSQLDIGESSNLAQIAQSYDYSFSSDKYADYACILAVIAQVAIDNAKRKFDIDVQSEIRRIKKDMDVATYKYPKFWKIIKRDFKSKNINPDLQCPMNYLADLNIYGCRSSEPTLPMDYFFINHPLDLNRHTCKKVEQLITQYSLEVLSVRRKNMSDEDMLLLRSDFDSLIHALQTTKLSKNYTGLMSWLINRAFQVTPGTIRNQRRINTKLHKNRAILLKVLYETSPKEFLKCFCAL